MNVACVRGLILAGVLFQLCSCKLLDTGDTENTPGRGATAFDPYEATKSGALKLSLQMMHGCEMMANGTPVANGVAKIPYPATCPNLLGGDPDPLAQAIPPTGTMKLVEGKKYFLNQVTLMDALYGVNTDPQDMASVMKWMTTKSQFKDLDWRNVGVIDDDYDRIPGGDNGTWRHEVNFGNANWMTSKSDTLLVELVDSDLNVRSKTLYERGELLAENSASGHSRISWRAENVLPPQFPGDKTVHPDPSTGGPPLFRSIVRIDMIGSTNPFKSFSTAGVTGAGALRVTWSQMPNNPFYFPVTVVPEKSIPATCTDAKGAAVACGFGLDPKVRFTAPKNGKFYEAGEAFDLLLEVNDDEGHRLHGELLPSFADVAQDTANGLLYYSSFLQTTLERDYNAVYQVAGPIQDLTVSDPTQPRGYWSVRDGAAENVASPLASSPLIPGLYGAPWPTRVAVRLPPDAKPGTYVALFQMHRQFFGERTSKTRGFFFQVGQEQTTTYPGRVGNCQICHRGVLSLDNLRHGLSVDHVEACKTCHTSQFDDIEGYVNREIHQIHFKSGKYPVAKNDCTMCHLTKESATRPSISVCSSCHPAVHGTKYFESQYSVFAAPNRYGNCADACHVVNLPTQHILPAN